MWCTWFVLSAQTRPQNYSSTNTTEHLNRLVLIGNQLGSWNFPEFFFPLLLLLCGSNKLSCCRHNHYIYLIGLSINGNLIRLLHPFCKSTLSYYSYANELSKVCVFFKIIFQLFSFPSTSSFNIISWLLWLPDR